MAKELFVSASFDQLAGHARQWLAGRRQREVLLIAHRWGAADDLARSHALEQGGWLGLLRYTLLQLATELAGPEMARRGLSPVTGLGFQALCARVTHACLAGNELEYLHPVAEAPGFVRACGRTLRELRLEGVRPSALHDGGPPARDLSRLLERFEGELEERKLADFARVFQLAVRAAPSAARFRDLPLLLLDPRPRSRAATDFLAELAARSPAVLALALESDTLSRSVLRAALGPEVRETAAQNAESGVTRLGSLRRYLFRLESSPEAPPADDLSVQLFSEPGEGRECVEIARRVRAAAAGGLRFDQVGVLLRNPRIYLPLVEDAFRRAGVEGFYSRGTIRPDPAGRAFLALLECAADGLSAARFAEYLSLGQAPLPEPSGAPPSPPVPWVVPDDEQLCFRTAPAPEPAEDPLIPDLETDPVIAGSLRTPAQWEQLLVEASVIGGLDRWERRLEGLEAEWELRLRGVAEDSTESRRLRQRQRRLADLRRFALPLIERLDRLPARASWREWIELLEGLAVAALERPASVLALLAELRPMGEVGPANLDEVRRVLSDRLTLLRIEPARNRYGCVWVGTPEEAGGRSFEWVFLPGLAEGLFPRKAIEDPLLLDAVRHRLGLESALEQGRREERLLLRTAVAAARGRLIVSYPRMDLQQGRSRVPSFYALDVVRAAEGRLPDVRRLERQAMAASSTRLGWPAPRRPEQAIDDAEYDLSLLEPLLKQPDPPAGAARFLLEVNPHLARSLRGRWQRWQTRGFTPADGLVQPSAATARWMEAESLRERAYSPTSLQTFAWCPYRFFLHSLHRLEPREEAVAIEQMDPLTRGSLFHAVLFELLSELRRRRQLPIRPEGEAAARQLASQVLHEVAGRYEDQLAPAIPRIWRTEIAQLEGDLRGWILQQVEERGDWTPQHFEFSFGLPPGSERDPASREEPAEILEGYRVRGSIDLLEHSPSRRTYRVTDHKTGRAPREKSIVVKGGELLQPLLYSLAAESLLGEPVETGRLSYCTQRGDFRTLEVVVDSVNCARLGTVLEIIQEAVEGCFLPAAPEEKACGFCDYRLVCGPQEELRVSRNKDPRSLARLFQLRALP